MKKKVVAIIQTRVGSTRLPGKALKNISGKPMLWHVVHRLRYCKLLEQIVVATTTNKKDDAVEKFCRDNKIDFFRGSENNVLDRYYNAAKQYNADIVVRITSDCPLIDPEVVDLAVLELMKNTDKYDVVTNAIERTYPRGLDVEVFSFSVLSRCNKEATNEYHKEHVTPYIYEQSDIFKQHHLCNGENLSHLRWTVDEVSDMDFAREIYKRLFKDNNIFFMRDVIVVLKKEPGLMEINKDVKQKL